MDEAKTLKEKRRDWTRMYHKTLKEIEAIINVQRWIKDIIKMAEEANTTIAKLEGSILEASINNWLINATNIAKVSEDLRYLVQSNMESQIFQIQRMLANELDAYRGKGNSYMNNNIWEIQDLYKEEVVKKKERRIEEKEVILIKLYEVSKSISTSSAQTSFITDEVKNFFKYMKFIQAPTQTRIFRLPPHYQSLKSREEQDSEFFKEVATALVDKKHNTETARNDYQIAILQGGPSHKPYFIAVNNRGQVIISPNKKTVAIYVVGELEVLIWFMRTWTLKQRYCYNWYLKDVLWRRANGNDITISYTIVVSVSTLCSRCGILTSTSCIMTCPHCVLWIFSP